MVCETHCDKKLYEAIVSKVLYHLAPDFHVSNAIETRNESLGYPKLNFLPETKFQILYNRIIVEAASLRDLNFSRKLSSIWLRNLRITRETRPITSEF